MKKMILSIALLAFTLPNTAHAFYDPDKKAERIMKEWDLDHDGSASAAEYLRFAWHRFQVDDVNKDGVFSFDEAREHWRRIRPEARDAELEKRAERLIKHLDFNKDGVVSKEEHMQKDTLGFEAIDQDHNGMISLDELKAHWRLRKKELDQAQKKQEENEL